MQHVWQHGIEAVVQGAQDGAWAWDGTPGQDLQGRQQGMVAVQCVFGEGTMKCKLSGSEEWLHPLTKKVRCGYCYDRHGDKK